MDKLKYRVEFQRGEYADGADAVLIISASYGKTGERTQKIKSVSGDPNKPISHNELLKMWFCLAEVLAKSEQLSAGAKMFPKKVHEGLKKIIGEKRPDKEVKGNDLPMGGI